MDTVYFYRYCGGSWGDVVVLKQNMGGGQVTEQVAEQVGEQVTEQDDQKEALILNFCAIPRSRKEIQAYLGFSGRRHFSETYLKPLLDSGKLVMTIPDKPKSRNQKYVRA